MGSLDHGRVELMEVLVRSTLIILLNQHILVRLRSFINLFTLEQELRIWVNEGRQWLIQKNL